MAKLIKYENWAVDPAGNVVSGAEITVREKLTGTLASLASDEAGTFLANPFNAGDGTPDPIGRFEFYVEPGRYEITVGTSPTLGVIDAPLLWSDKVAFASFAELSTAVTNGAQWADGTPVMTDKVVFTAQTGAAVTGLPAGLVPFGQISAGHFNVPTDGASDSGPAISSALAYAASVGAAEVILPKSANDYQVQTPIAAQANVTLNLNGQTLKKGATISGSGYLYDATSDFELAQANTLAANATAGSTTITLSAGKGANMPSTGYALIASTAAFPLGQPFNRLGWWIYILDVTGDTVTISEPLPFDFNTADSAEIFVANFLENVGIKNGTIEGAGATSAGDLFRFHACLRPEIRDIKAQNISGDNLVYLEGCVGARVDNIYDRYHDGVTYTVVEAGPNYGARITNIRGEYVRHVYTTVDTKNGLPLFRRMVCRLRHMSQAQP